MAKKRPQVALVYDFDGTLSPGNMQEFGFIQATGKTKDCLLYTSPSPRDVEESRMPSSA